MTELSVEGLQEALVVSEPHLVLDELDLPSGKAHLSAEASCQGEEHVGVPIRTCEIDLDLASAFLQGFDCHGCNIAHRGWDCTEGLFIARSGTLDVSQPVNNIAVEHS